MADETKSKEEGGPAARRQEHPLSGEPKPKPKTRENIPAVKRRCVSTACIACRRRKSKVRASLVHPHSADSTIAASLSLILTDVFAPSAMGTCPVVPLAPPSITQDVQLPCPLNCRLLLNCAVADNNDVGTY